MTRSIYLVSLMCGVLALGCGDDKNPNNPTVNPTPGGNDEGDEDSAEDTGNEDTGTPGTATVPNPTTGAPDGTTGVGDTGNPGTTPTSATESSDSEGNTFILPPDGGVAGECDVFAQDCPDGEKCSAYADDGGSSWNNTKCVPVMENPAQAGDDCTVEGNGVSGIDNCDKGAMCWDSNAEGIGYCVALCTGTVESPVCDPGFNCAVVNEGVLNLCLAGCDPLSQDCPMEDDLCIPADSGFLCVLDASGEEGQVNDPCMYANSCDKGLMCLVSASALECDQNSQGCCQPFCDTSLGDDQCSGQGQKCESYYAEGQAPPGYEKVGVCAIPA